MATNQYGYTSKAYPFGSSLGVGSALPTSLPSRMLVSTSYTLGSGVSESIKIEVTLGKTFSSILQYMTVVDTSIALDLSDTEIDVSSLIPATLANWQVILKVSIYADENTAPEYNASEPVILQCLKNTVTLQSEVYIGGSPLVDSSGKSLRNLVRAAGAVGAISPTDVYVPLSGVQVMFYAKDTSLLISTAVTDRNGQIPTLLPPGSYDVKLYGGGFRQQDWLTGSTSISVGSSDLITRFGGSASSASQGAEFGVYKAHLAAVKWVGYFIPEDFTDSRDGFRSENVDVNYEFAFLANQEFGRIFRGTSFVDFVGIALDPGPR